jgi:hypothetical protein
MLQVLGKCFLVCHFFKELTKFRPLYCVKNSSNLVNYFEEMLIKCRAIWMGFEVESTFPGDHCINSKLCFLHEVRHSEHRYQISKSTFLTFPLKINFFIQDYFI